MWSDKPDIPYHDITNIKVAFTFYSMRKIQSTACSINIPFFPQHMRPPANRRKSRKIMHSDYISALLFRFYNSLSLRPSANREGTGLHGALAFDLIAFFFKIKDG